ncbi:MAG: tetratricopeptide repeat protein [Spirochaetes bacterium]|nr:tetratricopeptide repeat protein [Spirochaetota bacterium]
MANLILKNGLKAYQEGHFKSAIKYFSKLENDDKKDYYLGLSYVRLRDYESATYHLNNYLNKETDYKLMTQILFVLGYIFAQKGQYSKSKKYFQKSLDLDFNNSKAYAALGYVFYKQKNFDEAIRALKKAIEIDERNATAHNSLGYIYADINMKLEESIMQCEIAVKIKPNYAAYLDSLGYAHFKKGNIKKAKEYLSKAMEMMPENEEIQEHFRNVVIKDMSRKKEKID